MMAAEAVGMGYLDYLGRRVEVQSICAGSGRWAAWVRLKDGVNWKPWNTKRIRPGRDRAAVQAALDAFARERELRRVCPTCNGTRKDPRFPIFKRCRGCRGLGWLPPLGKE